MLEQVAALDQDPQPGRRGHRGDHRRGTGDDECGRRRNDEHRDRAREFPAEEERGRGKRQDHGQPDTRALLEEPQHRHARALDLGQESHDATQNGVGPRAAHLHAQQPVERHGTGEDWAARPDVLVSRLTRHRGLVDGRPPDEHRAIHRDALSWPNQDLLAGGEARGVDALLDSVPPAHRLAGGQRADSVDGSPRAERAAFLEDPTDFEKQRDQCRSHEVAARRRGEHRDRHQLVGGAASVPDQDAAHARDEDRGSDDERCESAQELADLPLFRG